MDFAPLGKMCSDARATMSAVEDRKPAMALTVAEWRNRQVEHRTRAEKHTVPARKRRDQGLPHPVLDFLFVYYPFPFSLLENWHPGIGAVMEWDSPILPESFAERHHRLTPDGFTADAGKLTEKELQRLAWTSELLEATRDRPPNFACHGLHEWAMVYGGRQVRHEKTLALRLPQAEIDALVGSRPVCCSHHDAFRFFAVEARVFNRMQPTLESRILMEQPGCLHANMDLYKWAAKAMPWVGSELLLDCFELAVDLRSLDMRASPYDLSPWGYEPVRIETPAGRARYEQEQKQLAARAIPLRESLITSLGKVLAEAPPCGASSF